MENAGGRKRAALWTIGKGSRGLLRFSHERVEYVIAGTTIAAGNNQVHIIRADDDENDFKPVGIYATDAEVWSMELVSVNGDTVFVIVATRRKRRSAAEIWSLSLLDAPDTSLSKGFLGSSADDAARYVDVRCSVELEGSAIKVSRFAFDGHLCLAVTNSSAAILKVDMGSEPILSMSLVIDPAKDGVEKSSIVDGGWITDTQFFIAYEDNVRVYHPKTGQVCALIDPSVLVAEPPKGKEREQTAAYFPKITSACVSATKDLMYIGCQDGSLQVLMIKSIWTQPHVPLSRGPKVRHDETGWVVRALYLIVKGHSQWVSVLSALPNGGVLSGDIDGLVRCWAKDGSPLGIFPQHVDAVTCATVSSKSFLTISYDGRIALNELPFIEQKPAFEPPHPSPPEEAGLSRRRSIG